MQPSVLSGFVLLINTAIAPITDAFETDFLPQLEGQEALSQPATWDEDSATTPLP